MTISLHTYLAISEYGAQSRLARALGVTQSSVSLWCSGRRRVPPRYCLAIEAATNGLVRATDLRPDVFLPPRRGGAASETEGHSVP